MNKEVRIKYNFDDERTDRKVIIFLVYLGIALATVIYLKTWLVFFGAILIAYLLKRIIEKPNGKITIVLIDGLLYVVDPSNRIVIGSSEIISSKFSWGYTKSHPNYGKSSGKQGRTDSIILKYEVFLLNGRNLLLTEELMPWSETPPNWEYSSFGNIDYSIKLIMNGSLTRVKKQIALLQNQMS